MKINFQKKILEKAEQRFATEVNIIRSAGQKSGPSSQLYQNLNFPKVEQKFAKFVLCKA